MTVINSPSKAAADRIKTFQNTWRVKWQKLILVVKQVLIELKHYQRNIQWVKWQ